MNSNDNWIAEQARLVDLEDGFGPAYVATRSAPADAEDDIGARPAA
jgi:hypothetical protein